MRYYLAYGSNLNKEQMNWRCPGAEALGTAEIKDYQLLFKGSGTGAYLTIEPKEGARVPVAVWAVMEHDEKSLDRYEGYPTFYYKRDFEILVNIKGYKRRKRVRAFAYIMDERRSPGVPTSHYIGVCAQGYEDFGFDTMILFDAVRRAG